MDDPLLEDRPEATGSRPETGEAIVVGAIGLAAPWFLTGWTHEVEIEFMIDTGCQVTILSMTVFERMCTLDPKVRSELRPCRRRLVSADSSPLMVQGELKLSVVFPGLCCDMLFVVANIGSDGLLGTEALQSYLPHQLDLRAGQLWAEGWSTLQLHQQRLAPELDGFLTTSVVNPPDSEIVAPFSVSGIKPNGCALVEPSRILTEEYGIVVGHTLVDASSRSGSVLMVDPNAGSHPSLGNSGRQLLRDILFRYRHVFPAPGEPVTGRTTSVQHKIITTDARPVRCGPRRLAPAGLWKEQTCVKEMLYAGQIEPSDSPWASPVVLVTKKDGSTRFCVDYHRLNTLTTKDAYPLPRIDDSLRCWEINSGFLYGPCEWILAVSGYWQVAMSPDAKRKAAFVTNEGLFQFQVMPFALCNAPATFERLMDRDLCGMRWSWCLVYLDDVISFGGTITEALVRLEE